MIGLVFSLKIPAVQNYVKENLVDYLEEKIQTKVSLEKVYVDFPTSLVMQDLYLQGQDVDTLLYVKKFDVGLDIWQLLKNKADIKSIDLEGVNANVIRKPDGTFNFDYIINTFATKDEEESESKPFIISLDKIKLKKIAISFIDQQSGNNIKMAFNEFDTHVKNFDLDKNSYAIDDILIDGLQLKLKQNLVKEIAKNVDEKVDSLNKQNPLKVELNGIKFTNFDIDYGDDNTQLFGKLNFKLFQTKIKSLDLDKNSYTVGDINLNGLNLKFNQKINENNFSNNPNKVDTKTNQAPLQLSSNKIN